MTGRLGKIGGKPGEGYINEHKWGKLAWIRREVNCTFGKNEGEFGGKL